MATIVPYRQQTSSVVGGIRGGTLRVDSSNPLAGVAQGIETYRKREAQAEVGKVQRTLAEKQAKWTVELANRKLDTNWGDQDFQSKFMEDYRADMDQLYGSTSSREATDFLNTNAAKLGASFLADSGIAQASRLGKHALDNAIATQDAITETILADPNKVFSLWEQYEEDVQGPNSPFQGTGVNIDQALEQAKNSMFAAHIQGLLNSGYNPTKLKNSLKNGDYSEYLTSDTAQKFIQAAETYETKARAAADRARAVSAHNLQVKQAEEFRDGYLVIRNGGASKILEPGYFDDSSLDVRSMAFLDTAAKAALGKGTTPEQMATNSAYGDILKGEYKTPFEISELPISAEKQSWLLSEQTRLQKERAPDQVKLDAEFKDEVADLLLDGKPVTDEFIRASNASGTAKLWAQEQAKVEADTTVPDLEFRRKLLATYGSNSEDKVIQLSPEWITSQPVDLKTIEWALEKSRQFSNDNQNLLLTLAADIRAKRITDQRQLDAYAGNGVNTISAMQNLSKILEDAQKPPKNPQGVTDSVMTIMDVDNPTIDDVKRIAAENNVQNPEDVLSLIGWARTGSVSDQERISMERFKELAPTYRGRIVSSIGLGLGGPSPQAYERYAKFVGEARDIIDEMNQKVSDGDATLDDVRGLFKPGGEIEELAVRLTPTNAEKLAWVRAIWSPKEPTTPTAPPSSGTVTSPTPKPVLDTLKSLGMSASDIASGPLDNPIIGKFYVVIHPERGKIAIKADGSEYLGPRQR
jgi:hypothetical protein